MLVCPLERPSSPATRVSGVPEQFLSAPSTPPLARGLLAPPRLAPGSERQSGAPHLLNSGQGRTHATLLGWESARRGSRLSVSPSPTLSLRGCKTEGLGSTDPGRPDSGRELGLPAPSTSLIPQCTPAASQPRRVTRRGPATKTAEACGAPRPGPSCARSAAAARPKPAAVSSAAPAALGSRNPRPAETGGRWHWSGAAWV